MRKPLTPGLVEKPTMTMPGQVISLQPGCSNTSEPPIEPNQDGQQGSRKGRWWTQLPDVCPITHFPVSMLPYPPHKLPMGQKRYVLVDGFFLALQVLETWNFEVLRGRVLVNEDLRELDNYMKRCKLGSFRLCHAASLKARGNCVEAQLELKAVRKSAGERLRTLRLIQCKRTRPLKQTGSHQGLNFRTTIVHI